MKPPPRNSNIAFKIHLSVTFRKKTRLISRRILYKILCALWLSHTGQKLPLHVIPAMCSYEKIGYVFLGGLPKPWKSIEQKPLTTMNTVNVDPLWTEVLATPKLIIQINVWKKISGKCLQCFQNPWNWMTYHRPTWCFIVQVGKQNPQVACRTKNHQFWFVGRWLSYVVIMYNTSFRSSIPF